MDGVCRVIMPYWGGQLLLRVMQEGEDIRNGDVHTRGYGSSAGSRRLKVSALRGVEDILWCMTGGDRENDGQKAEGGGERTESERGQREKKYQ